MASQQKTKRRVKLDLRKTMFVLPNMFTVSSIFCGFYAIVLASGPEVGAPQIKRAAIFLVFALFFDLIDGRVARLTRTQSDFGMELDSLADVMSFGLAPALLAYKYGLQSLGTPGVFIAFTFAACGAIRLARFNVIAHREEGVMKYFQGLPIPLAAGVLISLMIANGGQPISAQNVTSWAALMLVVSYLMVSNVRYRTFKHMPSKRATAVLAIAIASAFALMSRLYQPGAAMAMLFSTYVGVGLLEEVIFFRSRRRAEDKSPELDAEEVAPAFEEDEESSDQKLA